MPRFPIKLRPLHLIGTVALLLLLLPQASAVADREFKTTPMMRLETRTLIQINRLLIQLNEESNLDVVVILGVMGYLLG